MAEIILGAYPVSEMQQKNLKKKFPAFSSADCSQRAEKEGAYKNDDLGTGWYYTRSAWVGSVSSVFYVNRDGFVHGDCSSVSLAGVRVALQTIYNPECNPAKGCRSVKRTAKIWNPDKREYEKLTSTAPVVTFGKKEYIWLNKEECEAGKAQTMELVSLELIAKSVAFDENGNTNDFAKATKMHEQYFKLVTEECTAEELAMIVQVMMSDKDNYNSETPILKSKEQQEWQEKIKKNPNEFLNLPTEMFENEEFVMECLDAAKATIQEETMGLEEVSDEYVENVGEQLKSFSEKIEKEKKAIETQQAQENAKREKSEKNRAAVLDMLKTNDKGEGK